MLYPRDLTPSPSATSRPLLVWALAPVALLLVALGSAQLRGISPKFIYPEAGIFWPAWNLSFWILENDEPTKAWLFVVNLPFYYLLLSPLLGLGSRHRAIRIAAIVALLALVLADLFVSGIMANVAYEFAYGDHNFIPR
jgi:hypothetical protein